METRIEMQKNTVTRHPKQDIESTTVRTGPPEKDNLNRTGLCWTQERDFRHADVVFFWLEIFHMCGCVGLREITEVWVGAKSLWETGQLILSMRLMWTEVHIVVQRATTPRKGFFIHLLLHVLL
jgi:hypothetical protein